METAGSSGPAVALHRSAPAGERVAVFVGAVVVMVVIACLALAFDRMGMEVIRGLVTLVVLGSASAATLSVLDRRRGEGLSRILMTALVAKLVGMAVRVFMLEGVYGGSGDAGRYVSAGAEFADRWLSGDLVTSVGMGGSVDTERTAMVAGMVFTVTDRSFLAACVVFSLIAFWGQYLFTRALASAVPEADIRRYTILVMLFPSMLYWPSIVGKDSLTIGALGVASWGAARLLRRQARFSGVVVFLVGTGALGLIRPHLALISVAALGLGSLVGSLYRVRSLSDLRASGIRIVSLVALVGAASVATTAVSSMLGESSEGSLSAVLEETTERTGTGGSEFVPDPVRGPAQLVPAAATVLFRPFPFEADNLQMVMASMEGVAMAGLFLANRRRIGAWLRVVLRHAYLVYAAAYTFVFIVTFSYIANFGILARQRTQMFPLLFAMLAIPAASTARRGSPTDRPPDGDAEGPRDRVTKPVERGAMARKTGKVHQARC